MDDFDYKLGGGVDMFTYCQVSSATIVNVPGVSHVHDAMIAKPEIWRYFAVMTAGAEFLGVFISELAMKEFAPEADGTTPRPWIDYNEILPDIAARFDMPTGALWSLIATVESYALHTFQYMKQTRTGVFEGWTPPEYKTTVSMMSPIVHDPESGRSVRMNLTSGEFAELQGILNDKETGYIDPKTMTLTAEGAKFSAEYIKAHAVLEPVDGDPSIPEKFDFVAAVEDWLESGGNNHAA